MKKTFIASLMVLALAAGASNAETTATTPVTAQSKFESHKQELISKLPKDKAELLKKSQEAQKAKSEEISTKIKALRKDMRGLLKEDTFNKDAYLKKAAEITKLESEKFTNRAEAVAELASKFTVSERKVLIGAFERKSAKRTVPAKN